MLSARSAIIAVSMESSFCLSARVIRPSTRHAVWALTSRNQRQHTMLLCSAVSPILLLDGKANLCNIGSLGPGDFSNLGHKLIRQAVDHILQGGNIASHFRCFRSVFRYVIHQFFHGVYNAVVTHLIGKVVDSGSSCVLCNLRDRACSLTSQGWQDSPAWRQWYHPDHQSQQEPQRGRLPSVPGRYRLP